MSEIETEVLIVGGGPVGLSASVELSRHGISTLLVEKHDGTSIFPKARLVSTRTMEIFRSWGIQREVEEAGMPREEVLAVGVGSSLIADDYERAAAPIEESAPQSPTYTYLCSQDYLEVILCRHAEASPYADVRFGTEMSELEVTESGVRARVGDTWVRARYLVAADGSRSGIRRRLGIGADGPPPLGHMVSIMFDADLDFWPAERRAALCFLLSDPPCAVEAIDNRRRWMIQTGYDPNDGGSLEEFTPEYCLRAVRSAVGIPDLPATIVGTMPWTQQALIADSFRSGPVFLAGDSAHVTTPQGGFGMNCGIQDAHNLAWKLGAVLRGRAGPGLLDTYEPERRPVAARAVEESLANAMITFRMMEGKLTLEQAIQQQSGRRSCEGLILGFHYDSAAVVPDGTEAPSYSYRAYEPLARPGHRAPHAWITAESRLSLLDLFGPTFTLLSPAGSGWSQPAKEAAHRLDVPLVALELPEGEWNELYGVAGCGAVLVRPDGHVAWRTLDAPDTRAAESALRRILSR